MLDYDICLQYPHGEGQFNGLVRECAGREMDWKGGGAAGLPW